MSTELIIRYDGEEQVLKVRDEDMITFPQGLVGFPQWNRFVLLEDPDEAPLIVLQCIDDMNVSFLATDPWFVAPDYELELSQADLSALGLAREADGRVLCILVTKEGSALVTANLIGPIVINPATKTARQIVLQSSRFSAQHPVLVAEGLRS